MRVLEFELQETFFLLAVLYGFFFSALLLIRSKAKQGAQFWLGIYLLAFTLCLLDTLLKITDLPQVYPWLNWTYYRLLTLMPLTLWIYVLYLTRKAVKIQRFEIGLLAFVGIEASFRIYCFVIAALGYEDWAAYNDIVLDTWLEGLIIIVSLTTSITAIRAVSKHQKRLENNYSSTTEIQLQWVKELLSILIFVICIWIVVVPLDFFIEGVYISAYWIWGAQALIIFYFGLRGHIQPEIFYEFPLVSSYESRASESMHLQEAERLPSPEALPLTLATQEKITAIQQAMEEHHLYRQPKLSLNDMAQRLEIDTRQLSQLINQHYQCSFSDFVNQHRVEEVKQRILRGEDEPLTLLALAYDAGFNSKSSFNLMFKKFTGKTPTQFKRSLTAKG